MQNEEVKQQVDSIAEPIQRNYQSLIQQLRERNAVGVVVAVNGEIIWADIFASSVYWKNIGPSWCAPTPPKHSWSPKPRAAKPM